MSYLFFPDLVVTLTQFSPIAVGSWMHYPPTPKKVEPVTGDHISYSLQTVGSLTSSINLYGEVKEARKMGLRQGFVHNHYDLMILPSI